MHRTLHVLRTKDAESSEREPDVVMRNFTGFLYNY